ncbi:PLP-dependent aminotransferase family protein [Nonomuraea sp. NPDC049758]|uniref:aminotransferase-like domain-containing protein n=1 Tax=Nonomuraea sp. NPDC049758 TaxID=3154360 RepID=UPI0034178DBE
MGAQHARQVRERQGACGSTFGITTTMQPSETGDLMPSCPDAAAFPRSAWATSARRALTTAPSDAFGVGDPRGRSEVRQALVDYLARTRGVRTTAEHVVICSGYAHGLRLLCQVLRGPVAVEAYGLAFHRSLLTEAGLRTVPLTVDAHGARIEDLPATDARAVLQTPAHQYPTGGALHPRRRAAAIDWARATGGLVLEDDYDGELRYDREPVGAVQGLDPNRVVYFGSTSKSLSPSLHLGRLRRLRRLRPPVAPDADDLPAPPEPAHGHARRARPAHHRQRRGPIRRAQPASRTEEAALCAARRLTASAGRSASRRQVSGMAGCPTTPPVRRIWSRVRTARLTNTRATFPRSGQHGLAELCVRPRGRSTVLLRCGGVCALNGQ